MDKKRKKLRPSGIPYKSPDEIRKPICMTFSPEVFEIIKSHGRDKCRWIERLILKDLDK